METTFSQKRPYAAAILAGLLCTVLTALGSAIPQITGLEEAPSLWFMTGTIAVSAVVGMIIIAKSRFSISEYGFNTNFRKNFGGVWFYIPLIIIELIPIFLCGFSNEITPQLYIAVAFFTIAVGFNEEIYFRGLAFKFISEKGITKAIVWSSVIFGVLHIANAFNGRSPLYIVLQIIFAFLVGFVLAEILCITKSIWLVIIWHSLHDFIAMTTNDALDTEGLVVAAAQTIVLLVYAAVLWKKGFSGGMRGEESENDFDDFFAGKYESKVFQNDRIYDLDSFIGRNLSASYAPKENDLNYPAYIAELTASFNKHAVEGKLIMPNVTKSYMDSV